MYLFFIGFVVLSFWAFMSGFFSPLFIGIAVLAVFLIFCVAVCFINVLKLPNIRCVKVTDSPILSPKLFDIFNQINIWAKENGFHYVGIFQINNNLFASWENPEKSSFLVQFLTVGNAAYFSIETILDKNIYVETGNVYFGLSLPCPPGAYLQMFPKKNIEEIWELHNKSIKYLTDFSGVHLTPFCPSLTWGNVLSKKQIGKKSQPLASEIIQNSDNQNLGRYVRSLFLFPIRFLYWTSLRQFFWANRTIEEQIEMRLLIPPQELPLDYEKYFVRWSPEEKSNDLTSDKESTKQSTQISRAESNIDETDPDTLYSALYSDEFAVKPIKEKAGKSCTCLGCFIILLFMFIPGMVGNLYQYFGDKLLEQVRQSLAEENYDEARKKAVGSLMYGNYKKDAIELVAKEYASARRYNEAIDTANLLKNNRYHRYDHCIRFIISAKAADEQFDDIDRLISLIKDNIRVEPAYVPIAVAQARAGLINDVEETLKLLGNDASQIATIRSNIAYTLFDDGRIDEAIASVKSIPNTKDTFYYKVSCCLNGLACQFAKNGDIEIARQLLFDAIEINDEFANVNSNSQLVIIISEFRLAGKPEEGLRFVQEIAARYSDDEKNKKINQKEFSINDYILYETAMLQAELGNFAEGWKTLMSIKPLFYDILSPNSFDNFSLIRDIFLIGQKRNINMEAEMKYIENIVKTSIDADTDSKQMIKLRRLFELQIAARCFDDAEITVQQIETKRSRFGKIVSYRFPHYFFNVIVSAKAKAGKIDEVLAISEKNKIPPTTWREIIIAEAKADRFDDAIKHLSNCNRSLRESAISEIIKILVDKGQLAETDKILTLYKSLYPKDKNPTENIETLLLLCETYLESGNKDAAERLISGVIPLMNRNLMSSWEESKAEQFLRITIILSKLGRFAEALESAERISILCVSKRAEALQIIADAQTDAGNLDDAKSTREKIKWKFTKLKKFAKPQISQ
jgi:hypothetical protein